MHFLPIYFSQGGFLWEAGFYLQQQQQQQHLVKLETDTATDTEQVWLVHLYLHSSYSCRSRRVPRIVLVNRGHSAYSVTVQKGGMSPPVLWIR